MSRSRQNLPRLESRSATEPVPGAVSGAVSRAAGAAGAPDLAQAGARQRSEWKTPALGERSLAVAR